MTVSGRTKVRNVLSSKEPHVALCQSIGMSWVTLEGIATVFDDPKRMAEAERRYLARYRVPPPDPPGRVVIEIHVQRAMTGFH
jgi:hypothetical protein